MSWKNYFQNHILQRGYHYLLENRVTLIDIESDHIYAMVSGTMDYMIEADFEQNQLVSLFCTCPHAADDNFCKHMAATMYAFEDQNKQYETSEAVESVEEVVNHADEKIVREFLTEVLIDDATLLKQFKVSLGTTITSLDMKQLKNDLSEIFGNYLYPDGFIRYNEAWDFYSALSKFMTQTIERILINQASYYEAFELTNEIFLNLYQLPLDDSAGTTTDIADDCYELWELILKRSSDDFKHKMAAWFIQTIETKNLDYLEEYIEDILYLNFQEKQFFPVKISLAERMIEKFKTTDSDFSSEYNIEKWALYYLSTLEKLDGQDKEINQFVEDHLNYMRVRLFYVERLIASHEIEEAIHLLEEARNIDNKFRVLSGKYREKLKELYKKTENNSGYLEELRSLVVYHGSSRMDLFEEYKEQFNEEEWIKKRGPLIKEVIPWRGQDTLLKEEEMYEDLFQLAIDSSGLSLLYEHQDILYEMGTDKVLDKYKEHILEQSKLTTNRKTYQAISNTIREMKEVSNNHPQVNKLVTYLRETYKNRPAMMDELSKI